MKNLPPALRALISQIAALCVVAGLILMGDAFLNFRAPIWAAAIVQGLIAASVGKLLLLPPWWVLINFLFFPSIVLGTAFEIPPWIFLIGFAVLLLINWNSFTDRVPLYLTSQKGWEEIEKLLPHEKEDFKFIDLGCGLGGTLFYLSKKYPNAQFIGVDTAPIVFLFTWLRSLAFGNVKIRRKDIWKVDLSEYDVVYCFLSPAPMPRLWKKVTTEMRKGTRFISNSFEVPGQTPTSLIHLRDWRDSCLYFWKF